MSRRVLLTLLAVLCSASLLLSACGKKNRDGDASGDPGDTKTEDVATPAQAPTQTPAPTQAAVSATAYKQKYQNFLNSEEKLYFDFYIGSDNAKMQYWQYGDLKDAITADSALTFKEFIQVFCTTMTEIYGRKIRPDAISYAYLDCGNDGYPELALLLSDEEGTYMDYQYIPVIQLKGDKLELISLFSWGYRSDITLNVNGYYHSSGSSGAASWGEDYYFLDADGNLVFDYGADYASALYGMYFSSEAANDYAQDMDYSNPDLNIAVDRYYTQNYESSMDLADWEKICMWNYFQTSANGNVIDNDEIYNDPANPYRQFWDLTGLTRSTDMEIQDAIEEHRKQIGLTEDILDAADVEWTKLPAKQYNLLYSWVTTDTKEYTLDTPSWDYYCATGSDATTQVNISQVAAEANNIIDEEAWFNGLMWSEPDRLEFDNGKYHFSLYGLDPSGLKWYPYMMEITDTAMDEIVYRLDFTNYYKPEIIATGDASFVEESIRWAEIRDDILYVSTYHNTYAASAPQNGYITAIDLKNDCKVLWRTEPLTCNSHNFVVVDDAIICGYGFTAEDDYIYVLDRATGKRVSTTRVKTSPEWFRVVPYDELLYVRCYDTNYIFNLLNANL